MRLRNILFVSLSCIFASVVAQNKNEVIRVKYTTSKTEAFPRSSISSIDFSYSQMYDEENLAKQLSMNPDSVMALLYPKQTTAYISELMTDNLEDFNFETKTGMRLNSYYPADDYIFSYQTTPANAVYSLKEDAPLLVWNTYCDAIQRCNLILQNTTNQALQGEAYLCRAWLHFQLAMAFSPIWRDDVVSTKELGLPYMKSIEHGQKIEDVRLSVAEFYNQLELDLMQGIEMVGDAGTIYRFNQRSANAFAARFYLMKRNWNKVLQYANAALGTGTPELRDWTALESCTTADDRTKIWFSDTKTNLMLHDTYSHRGQSLHFRYGAINEALVGLGYGYNTQNRSEIIPGGPWPKLLSYEIPWYWQSIPELRFTTKQRGIFEYTDMDKGIGLYHNIYIPFSVGETLFARAEARLYLGDWAGCLEDINLWTQNTNKSTISLKALHGWCEKNRDDYHLTLRPADVSSSFAMPTNTFTDSEGVTITFEDLLQCLVHMRRMDTYSQDCRLFDLKRYGMPIVHKVAEARRSYVMSYDDASDCHYYLSLPTDNIVLGTPSYNIQFNDGTNREISSNQVDRIDFSVDLDADKQFTESVEELNANAQHGWIVQNFNNLNGSYSFVDSIHAFADGALMVDGKEITVDGCSGDTWTCHSNDLFGRTEYRIFPCPESGRETYDHEAIYQAYNAFSLPYYIVKCDGQVIDSLTINIRKTQTDYYEAAEYKYQNVILREDGSALVLAYTPNGFRVKSGILPEDCSLEFVGDDQNIKFTSTDGHYTIEPDLQKCLLLSSRTYSINAPREELSTAFKNLQATLGTTTIDMENQQIKITFRNSQKRTGYIYIDIQVSYLANGLHIDIDLNNANLPANADLQNAIKNWLAPLIGDYTNDFKISLQEIPNISEDKSGETYYLTVDSWGNGFPMNLIRTYLYGSFNKVGNSDVWISF